MKTRTVFLFALLTFIAINVNAKTYIFKTTISGACPIKLYVNGNRYWIVNTSDKVVLNLTGSNNEFSATDAFGQNMQNERYPNSDGSVTVYLGGRSWANHGKRRLYDYRNGEIIELDYSSSSSSSSSSSYSSSSNYYSDDSESSASSAAVAGMGSAAGMALAAGIAGAFSGSTERYPNIQFQVGASHIYAEFARLKFMIGGGAGFGLALYGGIGKEFIFKIKNENMLD